MDREAGNEEALRAELEQISRKVAAAGLVVGPGGNLSFRLGERILITPSGCSFESVRGEQFVEVDLADPAKTTTAGNVLKPSSELWLHVACYRVRPDLRCILHTHPPYSVAVGTTLGRIPAMVAELLAHVPNLAVLEYFTPTTRELAEAVAERIRQTDAVLLKKHGLVVGGVSLQEVYNKSLVIEESARIYVYASVIGRPQELTPEEAAALRRHLETSGAS